MNRYFYPAIFHNEENGGFWISFPDFPECMTQGEDMEDAYKMAVEAIGLCIDERLRNKEELPKASTPVDFIVESSENIFLIKFDIKDYRRKHYTKSI